MKQEYITSGTCSKKITVDMDANGVVNSVAFEGGCKGNTQGVAALAQGMKAGDVIARCEGIQCGDKGTSCPDQLSKALRKMVAALSVFILVFLASGCKGSEADIAVDALLTDLNGAQFKDSVLSSGVFSNSEAAIEGDNLVVTLYLSKGITLGNMPQEYVQAMKQVMTMTCRQAAEADRTYFRGFQAMSDKGMNFVLRFQSVADGEDSSPSQTQDISMNPADFIAGLSEPEESEPEEATLPDAE